MIFPDENDDDLATIVLSIDGPVFAAVERTAAELVLRPAELIHRVVVAAFSQEKCLDAR